MSFWIGGLIEARSSTQVKDLEGQARPSCLPGTQKAKWERPLIRIKTPRRLPATVPACLLDFLLCTRECRTLA